MKLVPALAVVSVCACATVGPPPREMPMLVVPLTLDASVVLRRECVRTDTANVALDYGARGTTPSRTATSYKNVRYYLCPDATVEHLAGHP